MRGAVKILLTVALVALSCGGAVYAQAAGSNSTGSKTPAPHLEFVFEEYVTLGTSIHPGATPRGDRNIVPITGGIFSGPKIRGKVMPGGWDWQLSTKTGCFSLHADYFLKADDGAIINVVNPGTICAKPGAHPKIFTTPTFEAPLGPEGWLNGGAYIGTLELAKLDGKTAVHIRYYQVK
ncbi:MAG: DUF3237 domain-containing protein [Candidatus Acidiferrales bacterium]